jgi:outer membrane receptor protein involved in Fe transport
MRGLGFALGASLLALATQANAQATDARPRDGAAQTREAPPEPDAAPADIVVTAQKRSESLQRVPIAVSAFSGDTIQRKAIDDAVDLSFSVPNLTVTDVGNASLRGVGNLAISSTAEGGLAYHVNGAYLGNPGAETEYYDLERIEVLRGPQGTLYGRNSTAGVINIITAKPTAELGGYVTGSYGNYNNKKLQPADHERPGSADRRSLPRSRRLFAQSLYRARDRRSPYVRRSRHAPRPGRGYHRHVGRQLFQRR